MTPVYGTVRLFLSGTARGGFGDRRLVWLGLVGLGLVWLGVVVRMIIRVLRVEFAATRPIYNRPENVVVTQRLHCSGDRVDSRGPNAHNKHGARRER